MKILYIAPKYHQGNPALGASFEYCNFYSSLLKTYPHEIEYFPFDQILKKGKKFMNRELLRTVADLKPDLCFFSLVDDEIEKAVIGKITKELNIKPLAWFGDDEWRFNSHSRRYAPFFSFIVSTDPKAEEKYRRIGYQNIIHVSSAVNTDDYRPTRNNKNIDVSFVGSFNKERGRIISAIQNSGINLVVHGAGWLAGRVSQEEMVDLISRSKIGLSLNPPSFYVGLKSIARLLFKRPHFNRSPLAIRPDFWNFLSNWKEWQQKKIPQLKARTFEIAACRTLTMTEYVPGLEHCYKLEKEIITYKNRDNLIKKIKYYLGHPKEREAIALAGYKRTIQDHTYEKRFADIFSRIGLKS